MEEAWEKFKNLRFEKGAGDAEKLVLSRQVKVEAEFQISILLGSALEMSILEKIEQEMVQHFRSELDNDLIGLTKKVMEQEETQKLYTSKDKFDYMAEQNPALKSLKEKLGLDFEY